jgi:AraC-like DNA-binding protein
VRDGYRIERLGLGRDPLPIAGLAVALVVRGELWARFAPGDAFRLAAGDLLVAGPRDGGALAGRRTRADLLVFRAQGEWLARALALAGCAPDPAQLRAAALRAGTHPARRAAVVLRELAETAGGHDPGEPLARAARVLELLAVAFAALPDAAPAAVRRASVRASALVAALERLAEGPLQALTLSRFAAELSYSERQVSRLVRERLGKSFGAHVAALRITRAQRLLAQSELPVIEVAAESGFGSLAHFNQRFRARTGRTPSAFRAAARGQRDPGPRAPGPA